MIIKLKFQYQSQKEFRFSFLEMKIWRKGNEFPGQQHRCASSEKTLKGLTVSHESLQKCDKAVQLKKNDSKSWQTNDSNKLAKQ